MAQKQILLPLDTLYQLHIAMLQRELSRTQAQLMQVQAELQHLQTVNTLVQASGITLPVPIQSCAFDPEHGCLWYEAADLEGVPLSAN